MARRIRYTKHAIERMIERGITKEQVEDCIKNPTNITHDKYCNKIFQKLIDHKKLLCVIIKYENNDIKIITTYKTSKIPKYISKS